MTAATPRSLVVVSAGLSQPSSTRLLADRLAAATERHLLDAGVEPTIEVIELREHAQDLTNHLLTGFPSPALQTAIDSVVEADGLIAATPIFSGSYSSLFKMFFDVLERDGLAGTAGPAGRDRRVGPPLARVGPRDAPTVRVLQRGGRAHGRVRRVGGLGWRRRRGRWATRPADRSGWA